MNVDIKSALVFFFIGIYQGMILLDWYRGRQMLSIVSKKTRG